MGTKFDLPPDAKTREFDAEERMKRETLREWDRKQTKDDRMAIGVDAEGKVWIAQRKGDTIELLQHESDSTQTIPAPLADPEHPGWSQPRLLGSELLITVPEGLRLGDKVVLPGRFQFYDGARWGESAVVIASGQPEGQEPGTYWLRWLPGDPNPRKERLGDPAAYGVSAFHSQERIGLAWADDKAVHTLAFELNAPDIHANLISYTASPQDLYTAPAVTVDQTGKAYVLFYVYTRNEAGAWQPTREMQLNFERIAFKGSATEDGHYPVNLIHRKRIYMVYGLKPTSSTARWRVPGTTMWDGAEHIPGTFPQSVSDGKKLYVMTDKGLWVMGAGQADEGLDLLAHSWASPEGDEGPRNTFGAKLRRWFGF